MPEIAFTRLPAANSPCALVPVADDHVLNIAFIMHYVKHNDGTA